MCVNVSPRPPMAIRNNFDPFQSKSTTSEYSREKRSVQAGTVLFSLPHIGRRNIEGYRHFAYRIFSAVKRRVTPSPLGNRISLGPVHRVRFYCPLVFDPSIVICFSEPSPTAFAFLSTFSPNVPAALASETAHYVFRISLLVSGNIVVRLSIRFCYFLKPI